ncbi:MAG TPA: DegV family protein [Candidatus Limiplasma sp.]|nr:DegV family protein [Candidatus Limiplasma sp.]
MIRLIADSTCDIPKELLERFSIAVLRLSVILDGKPYLDGVDIQLEDVYEALRAGKTPKTSQIQWDDAKTLFSSVAQAGDDFIYLAFPAAMSGTYNIANRVRDSLREQYPTRRMEIIDSKGGSMGTGLIAIQLGLMLENGASFDELMSQAMWMTEHMKYAFTINDLKCAVRGGRVLVRAASSIGDILSIKPLMDVKSGILHIVKFVRGSQRSLEAVADFIVSYAREFQGQLIGITHADDPDRAGSMKALIKKHLPECTVLCEQIGSVLGSHLGIGGVGVFCLDKRPAVYHTL